MTGERYRQGYLHLIALNCRWVVINRLSFCLDFPKVMNWKLDCMPNKVSLPYVAFCQGGCHSNRNKTRLGRNQVVGLGLEHRNIPLLTTTVVILSQAWDMYVTSEATCSVLGVSCSSSP